MPPKGETTVTLRQHLLTASLWWWMMNTALRSDHMYLCAEKFLFVQIFPVRTPIRMEFAIASSFRLESRTVQTWRKALISIQLKTLAGPLSLRNVYYHVLDKNKILVLLLCPLLQSLGFDLYCHLSSVRDTFHDPDFFDIDFSPSVYQASWEAAKRKPIKSHIIYY